MQQKRLQTRSCAMLLGVAKQSWIRNPNATLTITCTVLIHSHYILNRVLVLYRTGCPRSFQISLKVSSDVVVDVSQCWPTVFDITEDEDYCTSLHVLLGVAPGMWYNDSHKECSDWLFWGQIYVASLFMLFCKISVTPVSWYLTWLFKWYD
jgi:hypothetical protein